MFQKKLMRICVPGIVALALPVMIFAETVGVFFDSTVHQISFAAGDVKSALESKNFTVEMLPIASLNASYGNKKVVIALAANSAVTGVLTAQQGTIPTGLGEQAYGLRTTATPQKSYWVFGGDANGAMYGGFEIADNIKFSDFTGTYTSQESPAILKRGIKLNLPWDKINGTYGKMDMGTFDGTSVQLAIKDVWDMTFWAAWLDEMARNRYNVLSLWSCNPFSALVSVPGYEDMCIADITLYDGTRIAMTQNDKIEFWKKVMAYAHSRGFDFYIFNWNVFVYGGNPGKYGITASPTDPETRDYMYKAMKKLLETYPDLDGFGMSIGENGGTEDYVWNTYGKAMYDYAFANPTRKLRYIHRYHFANFADMLTRFAPLRGLPNVTFDMSIKRSWAHMYTTAIPTRYDPDYQRCRDNNLKTWNTVRNDQVYYLTWGDPEFARSYINGMVALGALSRGFYMGCDGYNPTRTFFCKDNAMNGQLEVMRQKYMFMLWGRLSYNPNTPDNVLKQFLAVEYPGVSSNNLFTAWSKASWGIQLMSELVTGTWPIDFNWYTEGCFGGRSAGFRTIGGVGGCGVEPGSSLCSVAGSASNSCGIKKSSYYIADSIERGSTEALSLISGMSAAANTGLGVALDNIRALSYIGLYFADKIRGATYLKAGNTAAARTAMGKAYCNWIYYVTIMDARFFGMKNQRADDLANWRALDSNVLKEYTDLGGTGKPSCQSIGTIPQTQPAAEKQVIEIRSLIGGAVVCRLPGNVSYTVKVFTIDGKKVAEAGGKSSGTGIGKISLGSPLSKGVFLVELRLNGFSSIKRVKIINQAS